MVKSQKKVQQYDVYSNNEFIGFCFILEHNNSKLTGLSLFETQDDVLIQQQGIHQVFSVDISNIEIVKQILSSAISTFGTNSLTYSIIDENNIEYKISK